MISAKVSKFNTTVNTGLMQIGVKMTEKDYKVPRGKNG